MNEPNSFGTRLRSAFVQNGGGKLPDVLSDFDTELDAADQTAKMLVIPISQEIAPDFQLIGYYDTIRRIEEVLTQRGKQRNVMLYGDSGTGKSAITQGLVQRKNRGELSTHMFKRMFYRLNNSRLLHMDDVGEINKHFDQALEEFGRYDVMVIENFYMLVTYLKLKGANAVLVGLLEALSRRNLQAIITCSKREKTLILNEIPEVHELFLPEEIAEPNDDELLNILRGVHRSYEKRYDITITDDAICSICKLTQKYRNGMEGWAQPGRALILLDRAIAQFSVRMNSRSVELATLEAEVSKTEYELQSSVPTGHNSERLRTLSARLADIQPRLKILQEQWLEATAPIHALQTDKAVLDKKLHTLLSKRQRLLDLRGDNVALINANTDASKVSDELALTIKMIEVARDGIQEIDDKLARINLSEVRDHVVTFDHVANTFSELSGIPATQLNANERERVLKMEEILSERVFGQPQALKQVAIAVRRQRAKLTEDEAGPKGSFLLLGPSGVGKTQMTKALAAFLTADEKNMIRIDMSEFMEKHSVSRLIGAPPGYAGYDEGGVLTNAIIKRPQAVLSFDEGEKAHEDVFKILLQVLSDGRLTDGRGQTVDFRETYCCITSNLGGEHFINDALTYEQAVNEAKKDVTKFFRPEFLGRLDAIIYFRRLELPMLIQVAKRRVSVINRGIAIDHLKLEWPDEDIGRFCTMHQDSRYGARPILTSMKSSLEGELAERILSRPENDIGGIFKATFTETFDLQFEAAHAT